MARIFFTKDTGDLNAEFLAEVAFYQRPVTWRGGRWVMAVMSHFKSSNIMPKAFDHWSSCVICVL